MAIIHLYQSYISWSKGRNDNHFSELIDTFNLKNLKLQTCFKTTRGTLLDVLLTNNPNFLKKRVCETGLSDCHKMVFTFFRSTFIRLPKKHY